MFTYTYLCVECILPSKVQYHRAVFPLKSFKHKHLLVNCQFSQCIYMYVHSNEHNIDTAITGIKNAYIHLNSSFNYLHCLCSRNMTWLCLLELLFSFLLSFNNNIDKTCMSEIKTISLTFSGFTLHF